MLKLIALLVGIVAVKAAHPFDDDDYYENNIDMGSYIGVYLAVLTIALPFIANVIDALGIFNPLIYRLGDKAHFNFMKELLINKEVYYYFLTHLSTNIITITITRLRNTRYNLILTKVSSLHQKK